MRPYIITFLAVSILGTNNIENSIWRHKISKGCISTLTLNSKGKLIDFDCEMNYSFKGLYKIHQDTLVISIKDDSHPEDGRKICYYIERYLIKRDGLYMIKLKRNKSTGNNLEVSKKPWYLRDE